MKSNQERTLQIAAPVVLSGQGEDTLAGFYSRPWGPSNGVLQILLHGNSYDHSYWDAATINDRDYSYVRYMNSRGFETLSLDLPGVGLSTRPSGDAISLDVVAEAMDRLTADLRSGAYGFGGGAHLSFVGHSLGAMVATYTQAQSAPADSIVLQGVGFYTARKTSGWAPGVRERLMTTEYVLLPAEMRQQFYHLPQTDPDVVAYDNAQLRRSVSRRLWMDTIELREDRTNRVASGVECPVYVQLGEYDPTMFGEYAEFEAACYPNAQAVTVESLADMGHCFNLHLNRERSWQMLASHLMRYAKVSHD